MKYIAEGRKIQKLVSIFSCINDVRIAYIYGSALQKKSFPNDLDVAVLIKRDKVGLYSSINVLDFSLRLEESTKINQLDLKILNMAPLYFQYIVISTGKCIYSKSKRILVEYEANLLSSYLDFKYILERYNKIFFKKIRERKYEI